MRARSSSVSSCAGLESVGTLRFGLRLRASSNNRFWSAFNESVLEGPLRRDRGCRRGLLSAGALLVCGRLAVAFLQTAHHQGGDELLFAVVVELDGDALFAAGEHRPQAELLVLDLSALRIGIGSHRFSTLYSSDGLLETKKPTCRQQGYRGDAPQ